MKKLTADGLARNHQAIGGQFFHPPSRAQKIYLSIWRRFLDVYQRDIKGREDIRSSKMTQQGNQKAHHGDALGDALVFDRDKRSDRRLYRELYGLSYEQVLTFRMYNNDYLCQELTQYRLCDC